MFTLIVALLLAVQLNPNPGFEANLGSYTIGGNHAGTRITTDFYAGVACMQVVASGVGDPGTNRVRLDAPTAAIGQSFRVTFAAKQVSGNNILTLQYGVGKLQSFTLNQFWGTYSFTIRSVPTAGNFRWYLNGAGTFNIDAILVTYLDAPIPIYLD